MVAWDVDGPLLVSVLSESGLVAAIPVADVVSFGIVFDDTLACVVVVVAGVVVAALSIEEDDVVLVNSERICSYCST